MADGISDGQLVTLATIVGAGLTALGVAIRWSAGLIGAAFKETREAMAATRSEMTQVIRDNTAAFAKFTEWLGRVDVRTEETTRRVVEVHQEISGVHEAPTTEAIVAEGRTGTARDEGRTGTARDEGRTGTARDEGRTGTAREDGDDDSSESTPVDLPSRRHPRAASPAKGAGVGYSFVKSDKKR